MQHFLAFGMPGPEELLVLAIIGVIVFGKRLPEVGKNLGKGIVEFKKGLKGIDEEVERASSVPTTPVLVHTPPVVTSIPPEGFKFDPVTGQPVQEAATAIPPGAKFDPFTGKPIGTEQIGAVS